MLKPTHGTSHAGMAEGAPAETQAPLPPRSHIASDPGGAGAAGMPSPAAARLVRTLSASKGLQSMNSNSRLHTRMLCEGALLVALAQILSYIKLAEAPNGGSVTPAMFPILFFAVRWGLRPGLMAGFTFGLLQLIFDGAHAWGWQSILLDYLLAFTPLGLAGLFRGKQGGLFAGGVVGCCARFAVHYLSGVTVYKIVAPTEFLGWSFSSPSLYSLVYNGVYMLPNALLLLVMAAALHTPLQRYALGRDLW